MNASLAFCRGGLGDLAEAATIMAAAFDPVHGEAWTPAQLGGILVMPGVWLTLARIDGRPAGFSLHRAVADEAELLLLAVAPPFRAAGLGRALIEHGCGEARIRGARRMHLEVRENNPAVGLYRSTGFAAVGRRTGYYRRSDGGVADGLTFWRALD